MRTGSQSAAAAGKARREDDREQKWGRDAGGRCVEGKGGEAGRCKTQRGRGTGA